VDRERGPVIKRSRTASPVPRKPASPLPAKMRGATPVTAQPRAVRSPSAARTIARPTEPIVACTGLLVVRWNKPPHGNAGRQTFGVGVLIDDSHVLTCAHNIVDAKDDRLTGAIATAAAFYPGETRRPDAQGGCEAACAFFHASYADEPRAWDLAVVRLAAPIAADEIDRYPTLIDRGSLAKKREPRQRKMKVHGYKLEAKSITVTALTADRNALVHDGGALQGASGSPIYTGDTICGIHSSEGKQSFGVGLFDPVLQWIHDVTRQRKSRAQFVTAMAGNGT
jgi:V8-like Glu-specific endopeptidase